MTSERLETTSLASNSEEAVEPIARGVESRLDQRLLPLGNGDLQADTPNLIPLGPSAILRSCVELSTQSDEQGDPQPDGSRRRFAKRWMLGAGWPCINSTIPD